MCKHTALLLIFLLINQYPYILESSPVGMANIIATDQVKIWYHFSRLLKLENGELIEKYKSRAMQQNQASEAISKNSKIALLGPQNNCPI